MIITKYIQNYQWLKILFSIGMSVSALFIGIDYNNYVPWGIFFICTVLYFIFEKFYKPITPIQNLQKYIMDFDNWHSDDLGNQHYNLYPEFTIKNEDFPYGNGQTLEWTKGEIGYSYSHGNNGRYDVIRYHQTEIKRIHIITFDGGKKTIVAPTWEPINGGRIYYYLKDSLEYYYQQKIINNRKDDSKSINKDEEIESGTFDIPIFKNKKELNKFMEWLKNNNKDVNKYNDVVKDGDTQIKIFYSLLKKYEEYQN